MQPTSSQFRMADRLAGGNLVPILTEGRDAGRSYEEINRQLFADFGIEVTRQTLARWGADLELDHPPAEVAS